MDLKSAPELRLFLGIDLPTEMRHSLESYTRRHAGLPGIRWTATENLHLTTVFLGNVATEMLPNLVSLLQVALRDIPPFEMRFARIRLAPKARDPHMIWAQFEKQETWLRAVRQVHALYEQIQPQGEGERRNSPIPHITLARLRPYCEIKQLNLGFFPDPTVLPVREMILWQSELSPAGAQYTVVERLGLGANFPEKSG